MKKVILGLVLGLALGYHFGYRDATNGEETVWRRTLNRFGASRMQEENANRDRMLDSVSRGR